ncbi:hypothetical protein V2J09_020465 [Rumex salicifolius]
MGAKLAKPEPLTTTETPETKLEAQMVEAMRCRAEHGTSIKSFNSIILKFPKIDKSFRKCKAIFDEFDVDKNGLIDQQELKRCFHKLEISFTEEESVELFNACDINDDMTIKFNEFIVLLCLVHLLKNGPTSIHSVHNNLESALEILVEAFVFLDKNKDGYVSKSEMVQAINESGERSSDQIAMKRFEEMDWDKNGKVNIKEFLFAFTQWVGIDDVEDEEEEEEGSV